MGHAAQGPWLDPKLAYLLIREQLFCHLVTELVHFFCGSI